MEVKQDINKDTQILKELTEDERAILRGILNDVSNKRCI